MFISNPNFSRKQNLLQNAKTYVPTKRANKPDITSSILALASANISSAMTGATTRHQFAEIFHPVKYPNLIVYQYINKTRTGPRQVKYAFSKEDFSVGEWSVITKAVTNRHAYINGAVTSSPIIGSDGAALH